MLSLWAVVHCLETGHDLSLLVVRLLNFQYSFISLFAWRWTQGSVGRLVFCWSTALEHNSRFYDTFCTLIERILTYPIIYPARPPCLGAARYFALCGPHIGPFQLVCVPRHGDPGVQCSFLLLDAIEHVSLKAQPSTFTLGWT